MELKEKITVRTTDIVVDDNYFECDELEITLTVALEQEDDRIWFSWKPESIEGEIYKVGFEDMGEGHIIPVANDIINVSNWKVEFESLAEDRHKQCSIGFQAEIEVDEKLITLR
jgi:hypothetical protein